MLVCLLSSSLQSEASRDLSKTAVSCFVLTRNYLAPLVFLHLRSKERGPWFFELEAQTQASCCLCCSCCLGALGHSLSAVTLTLQRSHCYHTARSNLKTIYCFIFLSPSFTSLLRSPGSITPKLIPPFAQPSSYLKGERKNTLNL